jgi:hypothetical protein
MWGRSTRRKTQRNKFRFHRYSEAWHWRGELLSLSPVREERLNGSFRLGRGRAETALKKLPPANGVVKSAVTKVSEKVNFRNRNSDHGGQR